MAGERLTFIQPGYIAEYEAAIRRVVPETFFNQATEIVKSHKPTDPRLKNLEVLAMAKVLVVEDDKDWADIHNSRATRAGHEVITATSAEEARKVLKENPIDVIITDGLEGQWTQVHDSAKEEGIRTIVVSGSDSAEREAKKRKVEYIYKGDVNIVDKLKRAVSSI